MNENSIILFLSDLMTSPEGWGRVEGRKVYSKLIEFVEDHPGISIFKVSVANIKRVDISFASETIVEIARRYRGHKGFCFIDLLDSDMMENWDAAAERKNQPLMVLKGESVHVLGVSPSKGNAAALNFAIKRSSVRATDFVSANPGVTIANASMKFKQLWEQGFLLRQENVAESGGVEFVYYRVP